MGSPTDTPEVKDPCWPQGTSPAAEPPPLYLPRAPGDQQPPLAAGSLWHSLRQLGQGWMSWARWDGHRSPRCSRAPVTLNGADEPSVTCHLHPPATSPGTWQEEARSELSSRRGQSSGCCRGHSGTCSLSLPGTQLGMRCQKQYGDKLHKRDFPCCCF